MPESEPQTAATPDEISAEMAATRTRLERKLGELKQRVFGTRDQHHERGSTVAKKTAAKKRGSSTKAKSARSAKKTKPAAKAKAKAKRAKPAARKPAKKKTKVAKSAARSKAKRGPVKAAKRMAKKATKTVRKASRKATSTMKKVGRRVVKEAKVIMNDVLAGAAVGAMHGASEALAEHVQPVLEQVNAAMQTMHEPQQDLFENPHHEDSHHSESRSEPTSHDGHPSE